MQTSHSRIVPALRRSSAHVCEILEPRLLLFATPQQIGNAIELASGNWFLPGTQVIYTGDPCAVKTLQINTTGGLLGFPAGPDDDFLMMSTGNADEIIGQNTSGSQGTDLGEPGVDGDAAQISFTAGITASPVARRLRFNFMFLSEEYPEFVGSNFNDVFSATVNGQEVALDQAGNPISVNSVLFTGADTTGTIFDGRTSVLTATYNIPPGETSLNVVLSLADVGDGRYDSAVFIDSFRVEAKQQVYYDFDGADVGNHFGLFTDMHIREFSVTDLGFTNATLQQTVVDQIINGVAAKFAPYDIDFFTTPPEGEYMTVVIGGSNSDPIELSLLNPLWNGAIKLATGTFFPPFRQWNAIMANLTNSDPPGTILGQAESVDIGNANHSDRVVIFSGEHNVTNNPTTNIAELVTTIAHEVGHALGLRHISNGTFDEIMKQNAPTSTAATFKNQLLPFPDSETWADGERTQNADVYLRGVLGVESGAGGVAPFGDPKVFTKPFIAGLPKPIYNAVAAIQANPGTGLSSAGTENPIQWVELGNLSTFDHITLPWAPPGARIALMGSSTPGGAVDIYSGTPSNGVMSIDDTFVPYVGDTGAFATSLPLAQGQPDAMQALSPASLQETNLTDIPFLSGKSAKFTDADGDTYQVKLSGSGKLAVILDDSDGDGHGAISDIVLEGTTSKSKLSVTLKKRVGDGIIPIGSISGSNLKSILADRSDLSQSVSFAGFVGELRLRDIVAGGQVTVGGVATQKTKITLRNVGDAATFNFGTRISEMTAKNVGSAIITAPSAGKLKISGNFNANLNLDSLDEVKIKQLVDSATWRIRDRIKSATIGAIANSNVFAGVNAGVSTLPDSADDFTAAAVIKKLNIKGIAGRTFALSNTNIAASRIDKLTIASFNLDNGGTAFGIATQALGSLKVSVLGIPFKWKSGDDPALLDIPGDAEVRLL